MGKLDRPIKRGAFRKKIKKPSIKFLKIKKKKKGDNNLGKMSIEGSIWIGFFLNRDESNIFQLKRKKKKKKKQ